MVAITGNVPNVLLGKDSFQEVDIVGMTMPVTKHNYRVTDVSAIEDVFEEAFEFAKTGRPGPVLIDITKDAFISRITSYNVCYTKLLRNRKQRQKRLLAHRRRINRRNRSEPICINRLN